MQSAFLIAVVSQPIIGADLLRHHYRTWQPHCMAKSICYPRLRLYVDSSLYSQHNRYQCLSLKAIVRKILSVTNHEVCHHLIPPVLQYARHLSPERWHEAKLEYQRTSSPIASGAQVMTIRFVWRLLTHQNRSYYFNSHDTCTGEAAH